MVILDLPFQVSFAEKSYRYYEKDFARRYPKGWVETKKAIRSFLERVAPAQHTKLVDFLKPIGNGFGLYKLDFRVARTDMSKKTSGNRVIFSLSNQRGLIDVLLIYSKNHLPKNKSETQWIFDMVEEKYGLR